LIWGAHAEAAGSFGKSDKTAAAADELSKLSDVVLYLEYAATV